MNNASSSSQASTQIATLESMPDLLALHSSFPEKYPHLLSSAAVGGNARFDILFCFPEETLVLDDQGLHSSSTKPLSQLQFFDQLEQWWKEEVVTETTASDLPFSGGWFVYLSYEVAGEIEPALQLPEDTSGLPVALATRFKTAIIIDHKKNTAYLVSEPGVEQATLLKQAKDDLAAAHHVENKTVNADFNEEPARTHLKNLERIHQYILEGDIFQANLSRLWQVKLNEALTDSELFLSLKKNNPSPFACVSRLPGGSVISSSPERLVSVRNLRVDTRPIAGTRPRAANEDADQLLSDELISHPKERAEHIMLLDLERNDLGRVCVPGSIKVDELMSIESYQHVHHIVSNVTGIKRDNVTPVDVLKAVFPGGTITGCPKVRCMEILAELEQTGRGAYTGSIGYINRNGDMDFNILIRSLVKTGNEISFRAGGGIVFDSQPEHELEETRAKAKGMIRALSTEYNAEKMTLTHTESEDKR